MGHLAPRLSSRGPYDHFCLGISNSTNGFDLVELMECKVGPNDWTVNGFKPERCAGKLLEQHQRFGMKLDDDIR